MSEQRHRGGILSAQGEVSEGRAPITFPLDMQREIE